MSGDSEKLLLIDGHSLAYRAFFALPATMSTTGGQPTNAVFGFTSMLFKVLDEEKPDRVVVALDGPRAELERTRWFPEYKGHRPRMPDELRGQMEMIRQLLEHLKIPVVAAPGHEADDILATLAVRAAERGAEAVVVTGDRDVLQVVRDGIRVLMTGKGVSDTVSYDAAAVQERFGVPPERLVDVAGLKGDSSDNIPGVPGIGEKGATALIQKYGTLEELYRHLDEVSGNKRKASLEENRESAFLSRKLATLRTDLDLDLDPRDVRFGEWDRQEVLDYLSALEFKALARRFMDTCGGGPSAHDDGNSDRIRYQPVDVSDRGALDRFVSGAREAGAVGVSAVVEGGGYCDVELGAVAVALASEVLVAKPGDDGAFGAVAEILEDSGTELWFHEGKSVLEALGKLATSPVRVTFDTAIAAYLENPSLGTYRLEDVWDRNLGGVVEIAGMETVPGEPEQPRLLDSGDGEQGEEYVSKAASAAAMIYHLKPVLEEKLRAAGMDELAREVELPLMLVLREMEEAGVWLDRDVLRELSREAAGALASLEEEIHRIAGSEFKISSPRQLARVLFDELGLPAVRKTKTGYSTDASVLESLRDAHEVVPKILEYREQAKLKSTYYDVLPALICERTGRLHCSFNQTSTTTGRISSSNPNLQNIPVRTDAGRKIRKAFGSAAPGYKLVVADYSQIELRVLAHMSRDPLLLDAFERDRDVHSETASRLYGVAPEEVTQEMRRMAKVVNFGVVYGMGYYGLSSRLGISLEEATSFIDAYFDTYQGVKDYRDSCVEDALSRGYSQTLLGRRRFIPELASENRMTRELGERLAINTPLQGSAADIIKKAMVDVSSSLQERGMESRMTIQVHDELVLDVPPGEVEEALRLVEDRMSRAVELVVPLKVVSGVYDDWGEAKQ